MDDRLLDNVHEDSSVEWKCTVVSLRVFLKPVPAPTSCSESKPERMDIRAVPKEKQQRRRAKMWNKAPIDRTPRGVPPL
ncbi:hypothetical protein NHX12_017055 [Muraenolepis orangiensis]|uniref:Uncharacterized protein n=1 Tax=Muraenolepis orangiensis TaxID=630683 RepID=A0A9Q0D3K5_9TELE|nr:hypothetical protein NHX12_017055 [Muraenolepis orangiensis]